MSAVCFIFPHQLFKKHPALKQPSIVYLIEEELFFNQYNFHKKKLVLHRASMMFYKDHLQEKGHSVHYIQAADDKNAVANVVEALPPNATEIHIADLADDWLQKRLAQAASRREIIVVAYPSPGFLNNMTEATAYFNEHPKYFQTDFYISQRKQRGILMEDDKKPIGSKWSYDSENRLKIPKGHTLPLFTLPENADYVPEAIEYVTKHFGSNYGATDQPFFKRRGFYPVTFGEAEAWLQQFLLNRFKFFGHYEDAIVPAEGLLYHSGLSLLLNIGLLTPQQVIDEALDTASQQNIPLNSIEGFVRQIIGWREFIRIVYMREGATQRTTNYWHFTRKIPASFWEGTTGMQPVDITIRKVLQSAYCHHIERLMVMGNFMLLCEFHPDEVYRWFMELFIDAYDWVMVPNTYGMISFADGGLMTTKPYISSSNYLMKMGNWQKGEWQQVWDALFWRFMHVHRDFFKQNPRLGMLLKTFDKMPLAKRKEHIEVAEAYLLSLNEENLA